MHVNFMKTCIGTWLPLWHMEIKVLTADCKILKVHVEPGSKSEEDNCVKVFAFSFPVTHHARLYGGPLFWGNIKRGRIVVWMVRPSLTSILNEISLSEPWSISKLFNVRHH